MQRARGDLDRVLLQFMLQERECGERRDIKRDSEKENRKENRVGEIQRGIRRANTARQMGMHT